MTQPRDFDSKARAWLDLMPDEVPDRVIAAVLQAVDVTPQRRRPFDSAVRRFFPMNRISYAAIAAAIVVLGGGALLLSQPKQANVGPSQGPTVSPAISVTPAPSPTFDVGTLLPTALQARWFGGPRTLAGLGEGAGTTLLLRQAVVQPGVLSVTQSNQQADALLGGTVSLVNGRIQVTKGNGPAPCADTDVGSYAYSLSLSGETLTISDPQDPCAIRQAAIAGTWWRSDCKLAQTTCLGQLDAGTYGSQYIRPLLGGAAWTPLFGGLTFTVPDGWANDADWPSSFSLSRSSDFAQAPTGEGSPQVVVLSQVQAAGQGAARCTSTAASGVAVNAAAVIANLRTVPGLIVSKTQQLTIDGHPAVMVDVSVDAATVVGCADSGEKIVEFLLFGGEGYAIGGTAVYRQIFIDLGPGDLVAISIEADDAVALGSFYPEISPIIDTFRFK